MRGRTGRPVSHVFADSQKAVPPYRSTPMDHTFTFLSRMHYLGKRVRAATHIFEITGRLQHKRLFAQHCFRKRRQLNEHILTALQADTMYYLESPAASSHSPPSKRHASISSSWMLTRRPGLSSGISLDWSCSVPSISRLP